jgi:uncharacterized protein affecting Mg2+/Co2+ transport
MVIMAYQIAPNSNAVTKEVKNVNRAWAIADDNARYNVGFRLISIVENNIVVYRG